MKTLEEYEEFICSSRNMGLSFSDIADKLSEKTGLIRSAEQVRIAYNKIFTRIGHDEKHGDNLTLDAELMLYAKNKLREKRN